jgi:transcription initiation factor IIF auxiliary subunit
MAKDDRLELGRYLTNPFNEGGRVSRKLNFNDLFASKSATGAPPWTPSRFKAEHLTNALQTKKATLNPRLRFVGNSPFFDDENQLDPKDYELFEGLGRFNRPEAYDFNEGRALTRNRPQNQPDFNPEWIDAYNVSPTVNPSKRAKNPMPRMKNPDPNGYLMSVAENRVESEAEDKVSVAQLLQRKDLNVRSEEEEGGETITQVEQNAAPGKIT